MITQIDSSLNGEAVYPIVRIETSNLSSSFKTPKQVKKSIKNSGDPTIQQTLSMRSVTELPIQTIGPVLRNLKPGTHEFIRLIL